MTLTIAAIADAQAASESASAVPDPAPLTRLGPLELVAKFPLGPLTPPDLAVIILGLNFFEDNAAGATFRYRSAGNRGSIELA